MPKNQMRHWLFHGKDSDHLIVSGNVLEGVSLFPNIHTMDWLPKKVDYVIFTKKRGFTVPENTTTITFFSSLLKGFNCSASRGKISYSNLKHFVLLVLISYYIPCP